MKTNTIVATQLAPRALGPYSQARISGNFIFCSGQLAIDPTTNVLIQGDIATQTERVLLNIKAILEAGGSSLQQVVKTTVFLCNMQDFAAMNSVYAKFFPTNPPARATFAVAGLPLNAALEIECIAEITS